MIINTIVRLDDGSDAGQCDAAPREWAQWGGQTNGQWASGWWGRFTELCARYSDTIKGHFFGHVHTDQWTLLRSCASSDAVGGRASKLVFPPLSRPISRPCYTPRTLSRHTLARYV